MLADLSGWERGVRLVGTVEWVVDYYLPGPPPVVAERLKTLRKDAFYHRLVKLSDLKRALDARALLIAPRRAIGLGEVRLATSFGVCVVLEGDSEGARLAAGGAGVGEVNSRAADQIVKAGSRKMASECRAALVSLLGERWLTASEVLGELGRSYDPRTVMSQLRRLARSGEIRTLGRTRRGEGVYGLPGRIYPLRGDLSKETKIRHLEESALRMLKSSDAPIASSVISERLNASKHEVRSVLGMLSKRGLAERGEGGWVCPR